MNDPVGLDPGTYEIRMAVAHQEMTLEALESARDDLRKIVHAGLLRTLDKLIADSLWHDEPSLEEFEGGHSAPIYASDADLDDPDVEPLYWEWVPTVLIRAKQKFAIPKT